MIRASARILLAVAVARSLPHGWFVGPAGADVVFLCLPRAAALGYFHPPLWGWVVECLESYLMINSLAAAERKLCLMYAGRLGLFSAAAIRLAFVASLLRVAQARLSGLENLITEQNRAQHNEGRSPPAL